MIWRSNTKIKLSSGSGRVLITVVIYWAYVWTKKKPPVEPPVAMAKIRTWKQRET